jgi:hypothetical protein
MDGFWSVTDEYNVSSVPLMTLYLEMRPGLSWMGVGLSWMNTIFHLLP